MVDFIRGIFEIKKKKKKKQRVITNYGKGIA